MKGRTVLALAAALVLSLIGPSPSAQTTDAVLTVEGAHNAYADVTFRSDVQLTGEAIHVNGGGKWSAVIIEPLVPSGPFSFFAAVRAPAVLGNDVATSIGGYGFPAGTYRIRLLTDRQVTFVLSVDRGGRLVRPTRRVEAHMTYGSNALAPGVTNSTSVLAKAVLPGRRALMVHVVPGIRYEDTFLCASTTPSCDRGVVSLPSPLPSPDAGMTPNYSEEGYVEPVLAASRATRGVVFGVRGVRAQGGTERALSIDFT